MNKQQSVNYNKIVKEFNAYFTEVKHNFRLGQAFYNKYSKIIYRSQPNPSLFFETNNKIAMKIIIIDIEMYVQGKKYECTDEWYLAQCKRDKL